MVGNCLKLSNMTAKESIKVYTFDATAQQVRVEINNGQVWFVAKDVCDALGIVKYRDAVSRLDEDERVSVVLDTLGGKQRLTAISESGLYNLIFQSRKAEAKLFRKWVTSEVLPSIRRTGSYGEPCAGHQQLPAKRVMPRLRSAEMAEFYTELRRWLRRSDIQEVADATGYSYSHIMSVSGGQKSSLPVLELLVGKARTNRANGLRSDIVQPSTAQRLQQLRIEFMELDMGEKGGAL